MTAEPRPVRRIMVALDGGPDYQAPLQRAAALAREMDAELMALFVEDSNLFRLCGLQSGLAIHEVALDSASTRRPETRTLERELKARAGAARASLEQIAEAGRLAWSFQVWRGRMDEAVREAARQADLVSLGRALGPLVLPEYRARRHPERPSPAPAPVLAFIEEAGGAETAARIFEVAGRIARAAEAPLVVVVPARSAAGARRFAEAFEARAGQGATWRVIRPRRVSILKALAQADPRLVVLSASGAAQAKGLLDEMLRAADSEALLITGNWKISA